MFSQGVMPSKEANNNPGFCPIKKYVKKNMCFERHDLVDMYFRKA
jgi:hypothetical protein